MSRTRDGYESQQLGDVAERTLCDLFSIWLDHSGSPRPGIILPDHQRVDMVVEMPSLMTGVHNFVTHWQVKATSRRLPTENIPGVTSRCIKLAMKPRDWTALRDAAAARPNFYIALAVNASDVSAAELLQRTPHERFNWFVVDANQILRIPGIEQTSALYFPIHNRLTLSSFSLLWSSLWVAQFYRPLEHPDLGDVPALQELVRRIYPRYGGADSAAYGDWNLLTEELPKFESQLDRDLYLDVNLRLGLGQALGIINSQLMDASDDLTEIRNYCPESLFGSINLWLFSRSYRGFMSTSAEVVTTAGRHVNQRLLPLPAPPSEISQLVRCAFWHVALLYASFGVEVIVVYKPGEGAGEDHSYYGGGIDYFPWISLSEDGVSWEIVNNRGATTGQHLDFIREHSQNVYMTIPGFRQQQIANQLDLYYDDIRTAGATPAQFLVPESRYIEHPHSIFGSFGLRSIDSITRKLEGGRWR